MSITVRDKESIRPGEHWGTKGSQACRAYDTKRSQSRLALGDKRITDILSIFDKGTTKLISLGGPRDHKAY
jgi:hypothetical protein